MVDLSEKLRGRPLEDLEQSQQEPIIIIIENGYINDEVFNDDGGLSILVVAKKFFDIGEREKRVKQVCFVK